jgi:L-alanine-DL-glutamate epimerase-like enolase superfamily enzyme
MQIWQRMISERTVDVVQPDLMYAGGFIRALRIAKMAERAGLQVAPHSPRVSLNQAPMLHLAALVPNMTRFQEWQPNDFLKDFYAPNLLAINRKMPIPLDGAGWGMALEEGFLKGLTVAGG